MNQRQSATTLSDEVNWLSDLLDVQAESPPAPSFHGTRLGRLVVLANGVPLVEFAGDGSRSPAAARTTVPIAADQIGAEVVLVFPGGDARCPVILGCLLPPTPAGKQPLRVEGNDERLCLTAEREIALQCGQASITLTRAGKIIIRGAYVVSRSTGVNQIKGGSVQIN